MQKVTVHPRRDKVHYELTIKKIIPCQADNFTQDSIKMFPIYLQRFSHTWLYLNYISMITKQTLQAHIRYNI